MEANAALRNIVRRDNGEGYREMLERLAGESGVETPTAEDLARLERKRKGKKLSNTDWVSKSDPEAKIAKMKDGTTHLAYKPEHAVDLDTGAVVAAELHPADEGDTTTLSKTLAKAEANLEAVDAAPTSENPAECVADKGYHSRAVLRALNDSPWKTRIAAPKQTGFSRWHGDEAARRAVTNNRARLKSGVAREAFKLRAEIVERCFAHNLDRGGMRRTWLRGRENVHKRYLLHVAGHNLSLLMRQLIGAGTPREAVAGGYGGIFVLLTPTGAMLVHGGSRKVARRLSPPHSSSGSESRKKPLNQRAAMPAKSDVETIFKSFIQKADHALQRLFEVVKVFYGDKIGKQRFESFAAHLLDEHGSEDHFTEFLNDALPFVQFVRRSRNCVEHTLQGRQQVLVTDFVINADGKIIPPTIEVIHPKFNQPPILVSNFMNVMNEQCVGVFELMLVLMCEKYARPFSGFDTYVAELPKDQRREKHVRFSYCLKLDGVLRPIG